MAQVAIPNPRKVFNFRITLPAIGNTTVNQMVFQRVQRPKLGIEPVEHGDANYKVKTAGLATFSEAVLEKLKIAEGAEAWVKSWLLSCQDAEVGQGRLAQAYKLNVIFEELGPDNQTVLTIEEWQGCFPTNVEVNDNDRTASENTMESITLSVDRVIPIG
jgi:hypothetical protein